MKEATYKVRMRNGLLYACSEWSTTEEARHHAQRLMAKGYAVQRHHHLLYWRKVGVLDITQADLDA